MLKNKKWISLLMTLTLTSGLLSPSHVVSATTSEGKDIVVETEKVETESSDENTVNVQILATTDLHGKFKNYEYATNSSSAGGLNQIAAVVKEEKQKEENTIVIDNGDTIQGNYNHLFLTKEYLQKKMNPIALGLTEIGYDAFALGNHEFNYGMDILDIIVEQVENGGTSVLCANLYKDGERVFKPYIIKEFDGVKVAVIGVVTNHITKWDADKLVGYTPTNPAEEVKKVVTELKNNDSADVFIVSAHMGLNGEYGDGDSATEIANLNPELSAIIAGHSHSVVNTEVNGVIVTQPKNGGQGVAKVELEIEKTGEDVKVVDTKSTHIAISKDSSEDKDLNEKLESYHQEAKADATKTVAVLKGSDLALENEVKGIPQSFVSDEGVTDLINEVQLYNSRKHLESLGIDPSKVHHVSGSAMLSATANLKEGNITKADLSNIYKFDNKLYTIKTTGKQIKKYLEWTAEFYNTFKEGDFTVSFNSNFASYKYDMLSGVKYELNISKEPGNRVENLTFNDNTPVKDTDVIYLTVNDYRYSSNLAPLFDEGEHEKIYESINDPISDVRDMIADYIINVKGGTITRSVDNNWKLTGMKYNDALRAEVIKLINDGTLTQNIGYGVIKNSLTWEDVSKQLTEKGLTEKLNELQKLTTQIVEVLSFNDFHGNVLNSGKNIGAAKLTGVIKQYQEKGENSDTYGVTTVSAGDIYQGTAISNMLMGKPVNEMIKQIGIDASAIGNHEYDWGADKILPWAQEAGFEFVAANLIDEKTGKVPTYATPYVITEVDGIKVAYIGIATPDTLTSTKAENVVGLKFLDIVETVDKYSKIVRAEGADIVVALTHCSATEDEKGVVTGEAAEIAENAKDVDAVIAGHNHKFVDGFVTNLNTGKKVAVIQAGYNGRGLSSVKFELDSEKNIVNVEANTRKLYEEENLPVDPVMETIVNKYNEELDPILSEKVIDLEFDLAHDASQGMTPLGITIAEAMRQAGGTQVAIANGGGIRAPLNAGEITLGDMYTILPFDNNVVTMKVTGAKLKELIQHGINPDGFRWGQYSGLTVYYDKESGEITSMRLSDGTKVKDDEYYTLTSIDFLMTGGDGYNFEGHIDPVIVGEMREIVMNQWKANGIEKLNYDILIDGKDTADTGKDEEEDQENGEIEVKPEENPSEKPELDGNESTDKEELPETGSPISSASIILIALVITAIGIRKLKEKEDIA